MPIENRIITGNTYAPNATISNIGNNRRTQTNIQKFSARVTEIVDNINYIIYFEPINNNFSLSASSNKKFIKPVPARPKNNQIVSLPSINSIVTITVDSDIDASRIDGGTTTYYWELPTNVQNTRNDNIAPKDIPKLNDNSRQLTSYRQSRIGITK